MARIGILLLGTWITWAGCSPYSWVRNLGGLQRGKYGFPARTVGFGLRYGVLISFPDCCSVTRVPPRLHLSAPVTLDIGSG